MQTSATIYIEPTTREHALLSGILAHPMPDAEAEAEALLEAVQSDAEVLPIPAHEAWRRTGRGGAFRRWTDAEDAIVAQVEAGQLAASEAARMLGRTDGAIRGRLDVRRRRAVQEVLRQAGQARVARLQQQKALAARTAPRSCAPWTIEDDATMRAMAAKGCSAREIAVALGRTSGAVAWRLREGSARAVPGSYLHLPPRRPWTDAEDDIMAAMYGDGAPDPHSTEDISQYLHRPAESIHRRAAIIGLAPLRPERPAPAEAAPARTEGAPWTAEETAELRRAWAAGEPASEIALALRRPASEIRARADRLRLHGPARIQESRSGAWWTSAEDQQIRDELGTVGAERLAAVFGRTPEEVEARARIITQPRGRHGRAYTPADTPTAAELADLPDII